MKATIYLRIAKGGKKGYKVDASLEPNGTPIVQKGNFNQPDIALPTVSFGTVFNIDDRMFTQAETIVAEINVALKEGIINNEIVIPKGVTIKPTKTKK